jgi:hypothetical protein
MSRLEKSLMSEPASMLAPVKLLVGTAARLVPPSNGKKCLRLPKI